MNIDLPVITGQDLGIGLTLLAPVLAVVATAFIVLILDLIPPSWVSRRPLMWVSAFGLVVAGALGAWLAAVGWTRQPLAFGGFLSMDAFALFFQFLFILAAVLVILSASTFADRQETIEGEFYVVILLSTAGLMLMAAANELISMYLALELSSLSLAFLATWGKRETIAQGGLRSTEAGIKFFLLSAMSSAILLYGMAMLYGSSGATSLAEISRAIASQPTPAIFVSITMIAAGFGFKIATVPFHLWTPDVYQGSPTPVTAFFSVASKAAGFAVLLRVFTSVFVTMSIEWSAMFAVLAVLSMTVGNLIALVQTNIKRLMAYSSITQVGFILIGLAAAGDVGTSAILYYLLAFAFTNLAAFVVIIVMARYAADDEISGYAGLARRSPAMALGLTAALLSLTGIPPFAGFFGKMYLFLAAIERGNLGLQLVVIWAVIMSAVSLYYYGRVIHTIWMREPADTAPIRPAFGQGLALATSVVGVLVAGIAAGPFLQMAQVAAISVFR